MIPQGPHDPPPRILPDHSILSGAFVTSFYEFGKNFENVNSNQYKNSDNQQLPKKTKKKTMKNLSKIGEFYFMSKEPFVQVSFTINKLENAIDTKADIDQLWKEVTNIFLSEMASLPDIQTSKFKKQNKNIRKSKSIWSPELETLWSQTCNAEKQYLNFKVCPNSDFVWKNELRIDFRKYTKTF